MHDLRDAVNSCRVKGPIIRNYSLYNVRRDNFLPENLKVRKTLVCNPIRSFTDSARGKGPKSLPDSTQTRRAVERLTEDDKQEVFLSCKNLFNFFTNPPTNHHLTSLNFCIFLGSFTPPGNGTFIVQTPPKRLSLPLSWQKEGL